MTISSSCVAEIAAAKRNQAPFAAAFFRLRAAVTERDEVKLAWHKAGLLTLPDAEATRIQTAADAYHAEVIVYRAELTRRR